MSEITQTSEEWNQGTKLPASLSTGTQGSVLGLARELMHNSLEAREPEVKTEKQKQDEYAEQLDIFNLQLAATQQLYQSMRDLGYKSTARAIEELSDNSIQAGASFISVITSEEKQTGRKRNSSVVSDIYVVDDGHGMSPKALANSVVFGGTHRHGDKSGLGTFGMGLPSASISMAEEYTVYSKPEDGVWHSLNLSLKDVLDGKYTRKDNLVTVPQPVEASIPEPVQKWLTKHDKSLSESGTIIHIKSPDRLSSGYRTPASFQSNLTTSLGSTFRHFIPNCELYVNSVAVEIVDPLFASPGCRNYDIGNGSMANVLPPKELKVKTGKILEDGSEEFGLIKLRMVWMDQHSFAYERDRKDHKGRLSILANNRNFFHVCRAGRAIDEVTFIPNGVNWSQKKKLANNDLYWAIELDFDPVLDKEFSVTINKQQIRLSQRIWEVFAGASLPAQMASLRKKSMEVSDAVNAQKRLQSQLGTTLAEEAMVKSSSVTDKPAIPKNEARKLGDDKVQADAEKISKEQKRPISEVTKEIMDEAAEKPYTIETEALSGGSPFYRPEPYGGQVRLWLNTEHRFYKNIYSIDGPGSARVKAAVDLLLFTLAERELVSRETKERFYQIERGRWSADLEARLGVLEGELPESELVIERDDDDLEDGKLD